MKVLRNFISDDLEFLYTLRNNFEIQKLIMSTAKPYNHEELMVWLERKSELPLFKGILNSKGDLIGLVQIYDINTQECSAYLSIVIVEEYQGRGYGVIAITELETEAKKLGIGKLLLNVRSDNQRAVAFYERFGFSKLHEISDFYTSEGVNYSAQVFQKEIEEKLLM
jgi:diamine N-acetyltransferase